MASPGPFDEENRRLACGLLDNDERTLTEILRLYGTFVFKVLYVRFVRTRRAMRREDVEDVLVIALHRLWEARHSYDDNHTPLRGWFYRIAENAARDLLKTRWRQARRRERHPGQDWLEETLLAGAPEPATPAAAEQITSGARRDLQEIVNALSDAQRRIVLADAATRDAVASSDFLADELGMRPATIRVYRKRALDKIRFEMKKRGYEVPGT